MRTDVEIEFIEMLNEYKSTVYSVCMMFSDTQDETEDLVQEALINLWRGFQNADNICKSWVWRVTMNSCINIDRKKKRHSSLCPLTAEIESVLECSDTSERSTNVHLLYDRIHSLDLFERALVMLWLDGMPYDEIGLVLGITAKNVSVRLVRIKERLKQMGDGRK